MRMESTNDASSSRKERRVAKGRLERRNAIWWRNGKRRRELGSRWVGKNLEGNMQSTHERCRSDRMNKSYKIEVLCST